MGKIKDINNWESARINVFANSLVNIFGNLNRVILYKYANLLKLNLSDFKASLEALSEFEIFL